MQGAFQDAEADLAQFLCLDQIRDGNAFLEVAALLREHDRHDGAVRRDDAGEVVVAADAGGAQPFEPGARRAFCDAVADRQDPGRRHDGKKTVFLEVDPAILSPEAAEHGEGAALVHELLGEEPHEQWLLARHGVGFGEQRIAEAGVAVHGAHVEEDVDIEHVLRTRPYDPFGNAVPPQIERAAPFRVPGHDAALAERDAGRVERRGDLFAETCEPAVLVTARLAGGEDDGVVLVGGEQAFAAAA